MSPRPWRILVVDDQPQQLDDIERELAEQLNPQDGDTFDYEVTTLSEFSDSLDLLERERYDLVILDIRRDAVAGDIGDPTAGIDLYQQIKERRFVPVIFFTAVPNYVDDDSLVEPFVAVVSKDRLSDLPSVVRKMLTSGLPSLVRALESEVTSVTRTFLGEFAAQNWTVLDGGEVGELAHLLMARLAYSLKEDSPHRLMAQLTGNAPSAASNGQEDFAHPGRWYIYPPLIADHLASGAVICIETDADEDRVGWWLVITPACDIAQGKAEYLLMAKATELRLVPKYSEWGESKAKRSDTERLMKGNLPRYHFLPAFMAVPNLVVDFQNVWAARTAGIDTLTLSPSVKYKVMALLDSPFVEAVLTRYSHYRGRIGTPDLDAKGLLDRLNSEG